MNFREVKSPILLGAVVGLFVSVISIALESVGGFSMESYTLPAIFGSICGVLAAKRRIKV